MSETVLLGRGREVVELPRQTWEEHLAEVPQHGQARLRFMSEAHHRVRTFVVRELPRWGKPIEPGVISSALQLPIARVEGLLDELESNLFFLIRNSQGAVAWAYPVTVEPTPHRLTLNTGERLYGA